jgi:hypothetical protein
MPCPCAISNILVMADSTSSGGGSGGSSCCPMLFICRSLKNFIKQSPDGSEVLAQGVFESPNWIFKFRTIRLSGLRGCDHAYYLFGLHDAHNKSISTVAHIHLVSYRGNTVDSKSLQRPFKSGSEAGALRPCLLDGHARENLLKSFAPSPMKLMRDEVCCGH